MTESISINLYAYKNAQIENGRICIPIEENNLNIQRLQEHSEVVTAVWASFVAWPLKEVGKYGETHLIKQSITKEQRDSMTQEERNKLPIIGRVRELKRKEE